VLPSGDGRCPACGGNVNDRSGKNADLTGLVIRETDQLPPHCYHCDAHTERVIAIDSDPSEDSRAIAGGIGRALLKGLLTLVMLPFGWLVLVFRGQRSASSRRIRLKLPECAACGRLGLSAIQHVDFAQGECTLAVHREFKQRVLSLNPGPRSLS
jgi:hypothetical protein